MVGRLPYTIWILLIMAVRGRLSHKSLLVIDVKLGISHFVAFWCFESVMNIWIVQTKLLCQTFTKQCQRKSGKCVVILQAGQKRFCEKKFYHSLLTHKSMVLVASVVWFGCYGNLITMHIDIPCHNNLKPKSTKNGTHMCQYYINFLYKQAWQNNMFTSSISSWDWKWNSQNGKLIDGMSVYIFIKIHMNQRNKIHWCAKNFV